MWVVRNDGNNSICFTLVKMESNARKIKNLIFCNKDVDFIELLRSGLDPNFEGGWPIRLAARYGYTNIVETLLKFGANPHLLSESGELHFTYYVLELKLISCRPIFGM